MKKTTVLILMILASLKVNAQFIKKKAIDVSIGYGITVPYDEFDDAVGTGFYLQGEYVMTLASWIDIRPYAGLIVTDISDKAKNKYSDPYYYAPRATSKAFLFGGKTRIKAPIPWVAPYFEIGIGASFGKFITSTPETMLEESGFLFHIPVSLGLELGPNHNFDLAFTYYFHNSVEQYVGAAAIGISIPLGSK